MNDKMFAKLVVDLSYKQKDFFFIQAGACDGLMADPIMRFIRPLRWRGVFLEPDNFYMSSLKQKYHDIEDRFVFENSAISTTSKNQLFYNINPRYVNPIVLSVTMSYGGELITTNLDLENSSEKDLEPWIRAAKIWNSIEHLRGQGSFYKGKILSSIAHNRSKNARARMVFKDFDSEPEKYVTSSLVKCKTINDLIEENDIKKIDLLTTDIQGYDAELLLTLDSFLIKQKIIYFESHMIDENDKKRLLNVFRKNGYEGEFSDKPDSIFYRPEDFLK